MIRRGVACRREIGGAGTDLGGQDRRLGAALESQLGQHAGHVVLHRLLGQEHLLRDLPVGHPGTDQERSILELIAEGLTNRQIGERMFLAEKTVKNYVSNMLTKLGMHRRTEAAVYAARLSDRTPRRAGSSADSTGQIPPRRH